MPELELATGILLDPENKMLVVYRADHHQWELPGGKLLTTEQLDVEILANEEDLGPLSLQRAFKNKLSLDIAKDPDNLPEVGRTTFEQGGVSYKTRWYRVMRYSGDISTAASLYDDHDYVYPLARNFLRRPLSDNIRHLQRAILNWQIDIHFNPWDTVQ